MNPQSNMPEHEYDSPYINAPVWPWSIAGYSIAALMVLLFLVAWWRYA